VQRYKLTPDKVEALLAVLRAGELADVMGSVRICRDPDDDMVIETAINGHADALVSRDDDLKRPPELADYLLNAGFKFSPCNGSSMRLTHLEHQPVYSRLMDIAPANEKSPAKAASRSANIYGRSPRHRTPTRSLRPHGHHVG
jgi:hypothetical protein